MKKMLSLAALIVAMSAGGAMALDACSEGQLKNWNDTGMTTGGSTSTVTDSACYTGGSGNEADCDRSGNLVQVTITTTTTYPGQAIYGQPGAGSNQCLGPLVGEPIISTSCDISRTRGVGGTDFDYCDDYND